RPRSPARGSRRRRLATRGDAPEGDGAVRSSRGRAAPVGVDDGQTAMAGRGCADAPPPPGGGKVPARLSTASRRRGGLQRAATVVFVLAMVLGLAEAAMAASRAAVVVGANAAVAGRPALRYAHSDAETVARALIEVAGFSPGSVEILRDSSPDAILEALDRRLAELRATQGETMLLFYFSGHADGEALYSGGAPLPLSALKERLSDRRAGVRVGIVDACSGGAWTGAKGLRPAPEFEVNLPLTLGSEGSALLAASSGMGDAHESEVIGGSFFTHHLVAALRGAGDRSGDGEVTLQEAFDYAQPLTVRDSSLIAGFPQRPSFEINLRGRRDLALSRIAGHPNRITIDQESGPVQVIRLDSGLLVLELPTGKRSVTAALTPGRYVLRRTDGETVWAKEVDVSSGSEVFVRERDLAPIAKGALASKGLLPPEASTLPGGDWALQLAMGRVITGEKYTGAADAELGGFFDVRVGLTDRLQLSLTAIELSWRLGDPGAAEFLLRAGTGGWGLMGGGIFLFPTFGAQARFWESPRSSFVFGATAQSIFSRSDVPQNLDEWNGAIQAGWVLQVGERVTLSAGVAAVQDWNYAARRARVASRWESGSPQVELGSVLMLGSSRLPIAAVELFDGLFLDGYVSVRIDPTSGGVHESFLGGVTWRL
ncbi:MAG TPA: caspase family protein, partial [Vulgatibacter sp.]